MKNLVSSLCLTLLISPFVNGQPEWIWADEAGPQSLLSPREPAEGKKVIVDENDNLYVLGHFKEDTFNLQHISLYNTAYQSIFLAKYDSTGTVQWARSINGVSQIFDDWAVELAFTPLGNILIAGNFRDTLKNTLPSQLISSGSIDMFIAEYSPSGLMNWSKSFGSPQHNEYVEGIAVGDNGHIYLTGSFYSYNLAFDTINLQKHALKDIFVAKLDASGNAIWAVNADGGSGFTYGSGESIAVDRNGNAVVSGTFASAQLSIQGKSVPNAGFDDVFIAHFNTDGQLNWLHSAGGNSGEWSRAVDFDAEGNAYLGGTYASPTFSIGHVNFNLVCNLGHLCNDMFLAKYDPAGNLLWARQTLSDIQNEAMLMDLQVDDFGNCYTTGAYDKDIHVDQFHLTSSNLNINILTCKFNSKGQAIWVKSSEGTQSDIGFGITFGQDSSVYVTGRFRSPAMQLDSISLPNASFFYNYYVAKIKPCSFSVGSLLKDSVIKAQSGDTVSLSLSSSYHSLCWNTGSSDHTLKIPVDTFTVNSHILKVKASDNNGCEYMDSVKIELYKSFGTDDFQSINPVEIYPNPFTDRIQIKSSKPLNYWLTDLKGTLLIKGQITEGAQSLVINNLQKGAYTLRLEYHDRSLVPEVRKIVKQ